MVGDVKCGSNVSSALKYIPENGGLFLSGPGATVVDEDEMLSQSEKKIKIFLVTKVND